MKKYLLPILGLLITFTALNIGNISFAQGDASDTPEIPNGCLTGMGKGCFSFDNVIHGKESEITAINKNRTVMSIAQDVILAATYMVGTVLTIVIIYCGLMYIFAARDGKDVKAYKTGLINAGIGAILVRGAYAIVRLIQYIAKG